MGFWTGPKIFRNRVRVELSHAKSIYVPTARRAIAERVVNCGFAGYICSVFGIGGQEIVIIGLLFLVIFGPSKLPSMARDLGKFVNEARRSVDEFKSELVSGDEDDEDQRPRRKRK